MLSNIKTDKFLIATLIDGAEDLEQTALDTESAADSSDADYFIPQLTQHMTAVWGS